MSDGRGVGYTQDDGTVSSGGGSGDGNPDVRVVNPDLRISAEGEMVKGVDLTLDGKEGLFQVTVGVGIDVFSVLRSICLTPGICLLLVVLVDTWRRPGLLDDSINVFCVFCSLLDWSVHAIAFANSLLVMMMIATL